MLVGGLGSCNYLYSELSQEFQDPKFGITVLQPSGARPWTAICRGAVIRGINDAGVNSNKNTTIVSRVSRVSYGMKFRTTFDVAKHLEEDKYWDQEVLEWSADNQLDWYLLRVSA